jgi:uncharacterized membrane protein YkgB
MQLQAVDLKLINWFRKAFVPMARVAVFIVYFYFGALKLLDLSPASPLATALTAKTIGIAHYHTAFIILAIFECIIGLLFLFPKATRIVIPLLLIHMAVVCAPLVLIPDYVWARAFVPNLEGQYIIKNVVIIAVAIGIASQTPPLAKPTHR